MSSEEVPNEIQITQEALSAFTPYQKRSIVAPWWNTALVVGLIAVTSVLGSLHAAKSSMAGHHLANYGITILWEWALAGLALWGTRLKKTPLRELLGERRPGIRQLFLDMQAAALFWIVSLVVLGILALFLQLFRLENAQKQIGQIAPSSLAEGLLWIALSLSAGICEEFLFRGYLQQQFARSSGRVWVGVLVSSLLFGSAHGYEGVAGMLMITAYGALFSVLALRRRSLRAGMMAHAWHDSFTGFALWFLKHAHVPLGIL